MASFKPVSRSCSYVEGNFYKAIWMELLLSTPRNISLPGNIWAECLTLTIRFVACCLDCCRAYHGPEEQWKMTKSERHYVHAVYTAACLSFLFVFNLMLLLKLVVKLCSVRLLWSTLLWKINLLQACKCIKQICTRPLQTWAAPAYISCKRACRK